jgi:hypothetical protein
MNLQTALLDVRQMGEADRLIEAIVACLSSAQIQP